MYIYPGLRVIINDGQADHAIPIAAAVGSPHSIDLYILKAGELVIAKSVPGYRGIIHAAEEIGMPHFRKNLTELAERLNRESV